MKNILIISAVFHPEPLTSAMMNYDLAEELAKEHNVTVLRPKPSRPIGKEHVYDDTSYPFKEKFTLGCMDFLAKVRNDLLIYNNKLNSFINGNLVHIRTLE